MVNKVITLVLIEQGIQDLMRLNGQDPVKFEDIKVIMICLPNLYGLVPTAINIKLVCLFRMRFMTWLNQLTPCTLPCKISSPGTHRMHWVAIIINSPALFEPQALCIRLPRPPSACERGLGTRLKRSGKCPKITLCLQWPRRNRDEYLDRPEWLLDV